MLYKCQNIGKNIYTLLNNINSQTVPVTYKNNSLQVITKIIYNRNFCTTNKDDNTGAINYDLITDGDEELTHKLKVLELELEVMRQEGLTTPPASLLSVDRWKEVLKLPSRSARMKFYRFLFLNMMKKEKEKKKKLEKAQEFAEKLKNKEKPQNLPIEEFSQTYGLGYNTILLRVYDSTINQFYNNRLIQAMRFGEKIVIDCSYESYMTTRESTNCAKQLMLLFAENRFHDDPFDLHLCNANKEGVLMKHLYKLMPTIYEPSFPLNIHEDSYLKIFPKEQLLYLTPHCREEMTEYDPDLVYIIGGIVDKSVNDPVSLAKAKKDGLRMAKLPLDRYLNWGLGGKSLTLNQIISILLDIKSTGNWEHALRHVPRRKLSRDDGTNVSIHKNIEKATDTLRYDRPYEVKKAKWSPSNRDFDSTRGRKNKDGHTERLIHLRNILND